MLCGEGRPRLAVRFVLAKLAAHDGRAARCACWDGARLDGTMVVWGEGYLFKYVINCCLIELLLSDKIVFLLKGMIGKTCGDVGLFHSRLIIKCKRLFFILIMDFVS